MSGPWISDDLAAEIAERQRQTVAERPSPSADRLAPTHPGSTLDAEDWEDEAEFLPPVRTTPKRSPNGWGWNGDWGRVEDDDT